MRPANTLKPKKKTTARKTATKKAPTRRKLEPDAKFDELYRRMWQMTYDAHHKAETESE